MKKLILGCLFLVLFLSSCGGTPNDIKEGVRWRNHTNGDMTDKQLDCWWAVAQDSIGKRPFTTQVGSSVKHNPDPRAYQINPDNLEVIMMPDNGGLWFPGDICTNGQCRGMTNYQEYWVKYAPKYPNVLDWEFSNVILHRLGYDIARGAERAEASAAARQDEFVTTLPCQER